MRNSSGMDRCTGYTKMYKFSMRRLKLHPFCRLGETKQRRSNSLLFQVLRDGKPGQLISHGTRRLIDQSDTFPSKFPRITVT